MTRDDYNTFCQSLPHTFHARQWGHADVWKVGTDTRFKVFAIGGWRDAPDAYGITFKCGEIAFEMLRGVPGCQPAPYLASRGMKWILRSGNETLSTEDMKDYLRESHRLASLNLTKKLQKELALNQGDEG